MEAREVEYIECIVNCVSWASSREPPTYGSHLSVPNKPCNTTAVRSLVSGDPSSPCGTSRLPWRNLGTSVYTNQGSSALQQHTGSLRDARPATPRAAFPRLPPSSPKTVSPLSPETDCRPDSARLFFSPKADNRPDPAHHSHHRSSPRVPFFSALTALTVSPHRARHRRQRARYLVPPALVATRV